ncbi:hypothetical protein POSPLADRAFT_1042448 [Postia placenta MAD-698-R-SB12]|uniref:TPX2 C-terminal domain-containing protein n=1 Tax=Postia placenta MAD-698-R-SB12 TaxID=670580 RepID=A0A1X6NEX2_9APHY|nr:hypothetical protein POSPLADRAFT_1042448 [Postia placenta MAD-698-R-SB12]OSX67188.1 hypothetical protein POSPLADRAFT_1042448 [Postia placenta MAD-698-R-SB12]
MSDVEQIPAERIEQERKPRKQALQIGKTKRRKSGVIGGGMAKKTVKPKVPASTVARILSASAKLRFLLTSTLIALMSSALHTLKKLPKFPSLSRNCPPVSAAPDASSHQRKRSKTDLSSSQTSSINQPLGEIKEDAVTDSQREVEVPAPESSIASRLRARKPSADPQAKEARVRPGNANSQARSPASTAQHGGRKNGGRRQLTHPPVAPSRSRSASKSGDLHNSQKENTSDARALRQEQDGHMHRSGHMPGLDKSSVALPPAKPTRPIEFHFHSDARIEARKAELEKSGSMQTRSRSHAPLPIPDFKAMHAAQESALAARKEQIMPVVPMEMELNTDVRARERGKYDEARRERELEIEQQMEERRRQRELEEEKEIRELRRRAVPKANEVPEWYANAPKRTGKPKTGRVLGSYEISDNSLPRAGLMHTVSSLDIRFELLSPIVGRACGASDRPPNVRGTWQGPQHPNTVPWAARRARTRGPTHRQIRPDAQAANPRRRRSAMIPFAPDTDS